MRNVCRSWQHPSSVCARMFVCHIADVLWCVCMLVHQGNVVYASSVISIDIKERKRERENQLTLIRTEFIQFLYVFACMHSRSRRSLPILRVSYLVLSTINSSSALLSSPAVAAASAAVVATVRLPPGKLIVWLDKTSMRKRLC